MLRNVQMTDLKDVQILRKMNDDDDAAEGPPAGADAGVDTLFVALRDEAVRRDAHRESGLTRTSTETHTDEDARRNGVIHIGNFKRNALKHHSRNAATEATPEQRRPSAVDLERESHAQTVHLFGPRPCVS